MATQILEGTFAEVQQQVNKLHLDPERRVRFILEDDSRIAEDQNCSEEETKRIKNGVRLFPRSDSSQTLTPERIAELLAVADYEDAYPTS